MIKDSLSVFMLMVAFVFGSSWVFAKDTMDAVYLPVGTLTLSAPRGMVPQRSPVAFPHSRHFDYTCKSCHHTWDGLSQVSSCAASGCHDQAAPDKDEKAKGAAPGTMDFRTAYHQNCIPCHKSLNLKRQKLEASGAVQTKPLPKTVPTGCIECHPKTE